VQADVLRHVLALRQQLSPVLDRTKALSNSSSHNILKP